MNKLAYDPNKRVIEQWRDIYLNSSQIERFQSTINKLLFYLNTVLNKKKSQTQNKRQNIKKIINQSIQSSNRGFFTQQEIRLMPQKIKQVQILKQNFEKEYNNILKARKFILSAGTTKEQFIQNLALKYIDPKRYHSMAYSKIDFDKLLILFQDHLSHLEKTILKFYSRYISEEDQLIHKFTYYKANYLQNKINKFKILTKAVLNKQQKNKLNQIQTDSYNDIKTLYENIYIETDYLHKLVHQNAIIFQKFEEEHQNSTDFLSAIRQQHKAKMRKLLKMSEGLKRQVRLIYINLYKPKNQQIQFHDRLQKIICSEIAINEDEFKQTNNTISFANGFMFAVLFFSLIGILVFRGLTLSTLQSNDDYMGQFKIWRGASYLIFMNWVLGIVFYMFDVFKINYRLIMIEVDTFVPKPQTFLLTATILSAIYLILFLIYLLKAVDIIQGYDLIQHLGYFMWIINLAFLLNPCKMMNYQGRRYFVELFAKVLVSVFRPMNLNIFLVAMIMGSFVQPFTDVAFTACTLVYSTTAECLQQTRIATFVYTLVFLAIRFGHSIRSHIQLNTQQRFTKPILGLIAVVCSTNNVVSSYLYNTYLSDGLLIYWIISAIIATIGGLNADLRADWGLISFDKQDCILRKYRRFPRATYFFFIGLDVILNVGWVFSISNNLAFANSINPIYFLMVLSYIELSRKGVWIFFRVEDDHSANVGNLVAVLDDQLIYKRVKQNHGIDDSQTNQYKNDVSNEVIHKQSGAAIIAQQLQEKKEGRAKGQALSLQQLQQEIAKKKEFIMNVNKFEKQLSDYLVLIHEMYDKLQWEDQF